MLDRLLGRKPRPPVPMVLYTRPGCGLCEEMKAAILAERLGAPFELREVDIETDPELSRKYSESIPVLEIAGQIAFEGRLDRGWRSRFERLARDWYASRADG